MVNEKKLLCTRRGAIGVKSQEGQGRIFTVMLPVTEDEWERDA